MTFDEVIALARKLPGIEKATAYQNPALKYRGRLVARLSKDGETLAVTVDFPVRDALLASDHRAFFVEDQYRAHPWIQVRLQQVKKATLAAVLRDAHALVSAVTPRQASGSRASLRRPGPAAASARRQRRSSR